jgi:hypothetical protein
MIAEILLIISVLINILCLIYIRSLLKRLAVITDSFEELSDVLANFSNHLKSVHELETFYGDETLHGLIQHSVNISEDLDAFVKELLIADSEEKQGELEKDVGDDTDQAKEEG